MLLHFLILISLIFEILMFVFLFYFIKGHCETDDDCAEGLKCFINKLHGENGLQNVRVLMMIFLSSFFNSDSS